ncbi:MAG: PfkB family carbohydrate kinase, partial [Pseudomonadota bacterium]|nr:PfkB family carbohydrate kinase [Pseudomonadota bacterium]
MSDSNKGISGSASILVIGGVNIDIYGRADDAERATFSLADSYPGAVHIHAGGVARNIAENLGRLGLKAGFIGCFGQDEYTGLLTASLQDANVG